MVAMTKRSVFKGSLAVFLAVILAAGAIVCTYAAGYSREERLPQPRVSHTFTPNELGVVNFQTVWGDKRANVESMKQYVEQAYKKG